ncbi:hypothetical protein ACH4ND_33210 [Streptomyces sp. NPDC017179]|uniref:hypothetical protein n=1 Tax=Streptomyces sp. NPDC017179 TaxID=3364979 RepID=UPI003791133B
MPSPVTWRRTGGSTTRASRRKLLREVTGQGLDAGAGGETYDVDGTPPGRAFAGSQLPPGGDGEPRRWWVPILGGTERLGVLRVDLAPGAGPARAAVLASLVALLLTSKRPRSDSCARPVRTEATNVAAEMQWNLMPPLCFANDAVAIVAAMEPAYVLHTDGVTETRDRCGHECGLDGLTDFIVRHHADGLPFTTPGGRPTTPPCSAWNGSGPAATPSHALEETQTLSRSIRNREARRTEPPLIWPS